MVLFAACSFDYNSVSAPEQTRPDIAMENLEYVRVRGGDPLVRFQADYAERWEDSQTMALRNFSFEQMEDSGETINAEGRAGNATVELGSGNVAMSGGIRISIESEDIVISTSALQWKDKEKTLTGNEEYEVDIERSDGTSFTGRGFFADARNRVWAFSGEVKGSYVEKDDEDDPPSALEEEK
jgi:LPS export ABC transporter protein LptC